MSKFLFIFIIGSEYDFKVGIIRFDELVSNCFIATVINDYFLVYWIFVVWVVLEERGDGSIQKM